MHQTVSEGIVGRLWLILHKHSWTSLGIVTLPDEITCRPLKCIVNNVPRILDGFIRVLLPINMCSDTITYYFSPAHFSPELIIKACCACLSLMVKWIQMAWIQKINHVNYLNSSCYPVVCLEKKGRPVTNGKFVVNFFYWLPWQQHAVSGTQTSLIHLFALPAEPRHCQHQNNFPLSNICVEKPL